MINIEQKNEILKVSYFNENGNIEIFDIPIPKSEYFEWVYSDKETKFKSWDGKYVKKEPTKYLSKYRIEEILYYQPEDVKKIIYSYNIPKKFFVDIEVENDTEWPSPEIAKHKITTIAIAHNNTLVTLGLKPLKGIEIKEIEKKINDYISTKNYEPIKFGYQYFTSETDMLLFFIHKLVPKMPFITGWNFIEFDWTYIINRCKRLNIDYTSISPTGKFKDVLPYHRLIVDYLEVYKKWDTIIFKENNTLNYVAKEATGLEKIKYNGTLDELYENDYKTYIFYNSIDALLVKLIDDNIKTLNAFFKLAELTRVEYNRVFSPINMTEAVLLREYLEMGYKIVPKNIPNDQSQSYEGAYVFEPKKGIYEYVTSFDFISLYPTIMRQWNISPETFIKRTNNKNEIEDYKNKNYIICASGAIFDNTKDSAFRKILTKLYSERKSTKDEMKKLKLEVEKLKKELNDLLNEE